MATPVSAYRFARGKIGSGEQIAAVEGAGYDVMLTADKNLRQRRDKNRRHNQSISLFVAKPTHEFASISIHHGHRIREGATLFGVDSFARSYRRRKPRDFLSASGNYHSLPGLDPVDQSAQIGFSVRETDGIHFDLMTK